MQDVETEIIMAGEHQIVLNKIIVDNWKHCQYVEKYFDQKGIEATAYEYNYVYNYFDSML